MNNLSLIFLSIMRTVTKIAIVIGGLITIMNGTNDASHIPFFVILTLLVGDNE